MIKTILVALDGSDHSNRALQLACDLAERYKAELVAMHVVTDKPISMAERQFAATELGIEDVPNQAVMDTLMGARGEVWIVAPGIWGQQYTAGRVIRQAIADKLLDDAKRIAAKQNVTVHPIVEEGDPAGAILKVAKARNVDMIVIGTRGLGDAEGMLFGSVSHKVAHLAPSNCVLVK